MKDWLLKFEKENETWDSSELYERIINRKVLIDYHIRLFSLIIQINNVEFIYDSLKKYHHHYGLTIPDYLISEDLIDKHKYIKERLKKI